MIGDLYYSIEHRLLVYITRDKKGIVLADAGGYTRTTASMVNNMNHHQNQNPERNDFITWHKYFKVGNIRDLIQIIEEENT